MNKYTAAKRQKNLHLKYTLKTRTDLDII